MHPRIRSGWAGALVSTALLLFPSAACAGAVESSGDPMELSELAAVSLSVVARSALGGWTPGISTEVESALHAATSESLRQAGIHVMDFESFRDDRTGAALLQVVVMRVPMATSEPIQLVLLELLRNARLENGGSTSVAVWQAGSTATGADTAALADAARANAATFALAWQQSHSDPVARRECEAAGGTYGRMGLAGGWGCERPTADAGKPCTDSSQCETRCLAPEGAETGSRVRGACADSDSPFGCFAWVVDGVVQPMLCAD